MRYRIVFYHGFHKKLAEQLEERTHYFQDQTCLEHVAPETYEWRGTLDLFFEQYGDKFAVKKGKGSMDTIYITDESNPLLVLRTN